MGNDGKTIDYSNPYSFVRGSDRQMNKLINEMNSGSVKTLIIQGVNPVYAWGREFVQASANVDMVIYIGDRNDETGSAAHYLLACLLYTSPSPRDQRGSRMPSSA